jgi:hypothetical protein
MNGLPPLYVTVNASPQLKMVGCAGCLVALFVLGGIVGVLLFGWKTLLGM